MKALWIRVEAHDVEAPDIVEFAEALGVDDVTAVGYSTVLAGAIAEHTEDGNITDVSDRQLEKWARWRGKKGVMGQAIRKHLMAPGGEYRNWLDTMGKLVDRRAKDRERKRLETEERDRRKAETAAKFHGNSVEVPRTIRGVSSATERNGTERYETVRTPGESTSSKTLKGGTSPRESAAGSGVEDPPAPPSRSRSGTATAPAPGQWPRPIIDFLDRFYPVKGRRRTDVERQLQILADGNAVPDAQRQPVRAYSVDRLAATCAVILAESHELRDLDKAIVVLLTKLGDTTDVSAQRVAADKAEFAGPVDPRVTSLADDVARKRSAS